MIEVSLGDIVDVESDLIVNASNSLGWMGGVIGRFIKMRGVAESIHYHHKGVEKQTKRYCKIHKPDVGTIFLTRTNYFDKELLIAHAITVKYPGFRSSIKIVDKCLHELMCVIEDLDVKVISIPILGSGTGLLNVEEVSALYKKYLSNSKFLFKIVCYTKETYNYMEGLSWIQKEQNYRK